MKITNLWKKLFILIGVLFLLASCIPTPPESSKEEVIQQEDNEEAAIVLTYQLLEDQYKPIIPFRASATLGVITDQVRIRLDIDEMEKGLSRLSMEYFDPKEYYYDEGQYLSENTVKTLIDDLNPPKQEIKTEEEHRENPRVFSHEIGRASCRERV